MSQFVTNAMFAGKFPAVQAVKPAIGIGSATKRSPLSAAQRTAAILAPRGGHFCCHLGTQADTDRRKAISVGSI